MLSGSKEVTDARKWRSESIGRAVAQSGRLPPLPSTSCTASKTTLMRWGGCFSAFSSKTSPELTQERASRAAAEASDQQTEVASSSTGVAEATGGRESKLHSE